MMCFESLRFARLIAVSRQNTELKMCQTKNGLFIAPVNEPLIEREKKTFLIFVILNPLFIIVEKVL